MPSFCVCVCVCEQAKALRDDDAGVSNKFVNRVADGIMDRLDKNGGGITAQEWNNRAKK